MEHSERSFEEFHLERVNFDLFYIDSPDLLVTLVNALLADAMNELEYPSIPCLMYDREMDSSLSLTGRLDSELLWSDNYSCIRAALFDLPYLSIPRSVSPMYPLVRFAKKNKALMLGAPQLEDVDAGCAPVDTSFRSCADDSWITVQTPTLANDASGWQIIA